MKFVHRRVFLLVLSILFLPATTAKAQGFVSYRFLEVVDTAGQPVPNATVETEHTRRFGNNPLQTDEKGTVKAVPVYHGDFNTSSLKVSKSGYLTHQDTYESFPDYRHEYVLTELIPQYEANGPIKIKLLNLPATPAESKAVEIEQQKHEFVLAAKMGDTTRIRSLLQAGVEAQLTDSNGIPAVIWAVTSMNLETINVLLENGADLSKSKPGRNALLYYLNFWSQIIDAKINEEIVEKLLRAGADVNATDISGTTPLKLAKQAGNENLIKQLESAGAQDK
jgi:hypothetical protein